MAAMQAAAKRVSTQHDHLDLLVNVAGVLHLPGELAPGVCAEQGHFAQDPWNADNALCWQAC